MSKQRKLRAKAKAAAKKRKAAMRATRWMRRARQISEEDYEEVMEFWQTASDEKVLGAVDKGVKDAGYEPGKGLLAALRRARGK